MYNLLGVALKYSYTGNNGRISISLSRKLFSLPTF